MDKNLWHLGPLSNSNKRLCRKLFKESDCETTSEIIAMGSGASTTITETPGGDLRLKSSGLKFTINQLRALNSYVDSLYEEDQRGRISPETESAVESLVQRIVDGAGQRDPRFRCCHLIALHRGKKIRSRSLEYLVTLDSLPILNADNADCTLQEGPTGFGKIRLTGKEADKWEQFLTPAGFLCRDKIVEHWVQLIARCTSARGGGGSRVLSAKAAEYVEPYKYCYLERVSNNQTSNDRRLAIVEGAAWVMVRVGMGEAEAKLVLGAKVQGCSPAAYSTRVPLTHPMALLHYTAARGGYYATAVGPISSIPCADRTSTWRLAHCGLEASLDAHISDVSTVAKVAGALNALVDRMRSGIYQGTSRAISRYLVWCTLRNHLDRCGFYSTSAARSFVSKHASHHLLVVLDHLLTICSHDVSCGYIYCVPRDAMLRRGTQCSWSGDRSPLYNCLCQLNNASSLEEIPPTPSECLETALFNKWDCMNKEIKSSMGSLNYSRRQLRYLWRLVTELIKCKNLVISENQPFRTNLITEQVDAELVIHALAVMSDQARDLFIDKQMYRSRKWSKLRDYYDASCACLVDALRREGSREDLDQPMKLILQWLYKGCKEDKKYLGPVLKPYLDALFTSSLENSWFLDEFDAKKNEEKKELSSLHAYCAGVHSGKVDACTGLTSQATWSKSILHVVYRHSSCDFRVVFPTGDGMAISFPIKPQSRKDHNTGRVTLNRRDKAEAKLKLAKRCVLAAFSSALVGDRSPKLHEEILTSVKNGNYWRNDPKPDIIPSSTSTLEKQRPATFYGFPEISITEKTDTKTLRKKYHTLRSLVFKDDDGLKVRRPRSAGSTVKNKDAMSRPSILETLDFINSVKDALCVDESGISDTEDLSPEEEWCIGATSLNLIASSSSLQVHHLTLGDTVVAMLHRGRFTALQELCPWLGEGSEGALFALHRLARATRSRSSERSVNSWRLPEVEVLEERYRQRAPDYMSGDEAPQPPPLPRTLVKVKQEQNRYTDYQPPSRLQQLENHLNYLENINSSLNHSYTGIINPIYDIQIPKDKFRVKRSKSLGRSFGRKDSVLDKYNITLGRRSGKRNDVINVVSETSGETGLEPRGFYNRKNGGVIGDSYKLSRATIE